ARNSTTIPFSLETGADVSLALYDLAGRRVGTLFRGFAHAGTHEVRADVSSLPPGVYVYRLDAAGDGAAKKMVITR
ncbi:MAG: T9SS type A sorting domain-containing protein, partial [bacterium]